MTATSPRRTRWVYSPYAPEQPVWREIQQDTVTEFEVNWNSLLGLDDATISTSTWTVQPGGAGTFAVTLSGETNSGGITGAKFTGVSVGNVVVSNVVTLSNGETRQQNFAVRVTNPIYYGGNFW